MDGVQRNFSEGQAAFMGGVGSWAFYFSAGSGGKLISML